MRLGACLQFANTGTEDSTDIPHLYCGFQKENMHAIQIQTVPHQITGIGGIPGSSSRIWAGDC
jgi:hypothetical protein